MNCRKLVSFVLIATGAVTLSACATSQLNRSTVATGRTATDIIYSMVLDNVALAKQLPGALPWHIKITQGTITINDSVTPTLGYMSAAAITRSIQLASTQSAQVSWTVVPVVDKPTLGTLQTYYQKAASGTDPTYGTFFVEGTSSQNGMPCGSSGNTKICVTNMGGFIALVQDVLSATAVTAAERGVQLPGPGVSIARP
jgi:hypothetical protein